MPKPTANTETDSLDIPFFYVRVSPDLLKKVEAKRIALGYNKRKSVEVMADLFLTHEPGKALPVVPAHNKKKPKPTPKKKK